MHQCESGRGRSLPSSSVWQCLIWYHRPMLWPWSWVRHSQGPVAAVIWWSFTIWRPVHHSWATGTTYSGQSPARPGCWHDVMRGGGEGVSSSSSLSVSADWPCALHLARCLSGQRSTKIPYYRSFSQQTIPKTFVILIYTVRFIEVKINKMAAYSVSVSALRRCPLVTV